MAGATVFALLQGCKGADAGGQLSEMTVSPGTVTEPAMPTVTEPVLSTEEPGG